MSTFVSQTAKHESRTPGTASCVGFAAVLTQSYVNLLSISVLFSLDNVANNTYSVIIVL